MNRKLKKSAIFLMIFLVLIISFGAISAQDNDTAIEPLAVDEIAVEENLEESSTADLLQEVENKTFTDLNDDIANKTEVDLESNYVYSQENDSSYANGITIDRELTINGNGKTLNPNGNLLFTIGSNGNVILNDLTIVNSYTSPSAMITNNGNLTLNNVTFTVERHILSDVTSGAKFITIENNGELLVKDSIFKDSNIYSDNIAKATQINIYGLIYNNNQATIENTIFDNNKLYNPTTNQLGRTIDICAVLHNKNNMLLNNVIIQNTNVSYVPYSNNHFEGIIFNEKGKLEINGSIIKDNVIYFPNTENGNLRGVIYSEDSTNNLIISNSIIVNNTHMQKTSEKTIVDIKAGNATLTDNYWGTNNPNFSKLVSGATPTNHINLTFAPEEATAGVEKTFDVVFKLNDNIITTLPNYTVTVNSNKLGPKDVEIKNGVGQYEYLPITPGDDTITINGEEYTITVNAAPTGSFTDLNTLINESSEVELYANYTYQSTDSAFQTGIPIDKEVTINGNGYTISSSASALFNIAAAGKLTLKNVTLFTDYAFDSPTSKGNIINNGILNLEDVTVTSLKTSTKTIAATILNKGTLTINNSKLIDSVSNYTGASTSAVPYGFIYNYQGATTTIENTIIRNNKIETNGKMPSAYGLIYNYRATLNLNNVNFTDNIIKESSTANTGTTNIYGLIYSNNLQTNGKLIIDNCNFENTIITSVSGTATSKLASVIYSNSGDNEIEISNSKFINNKIESDHGVLYGAIYSSTQLGISDSIFENNTGKESAAIYATKILTSQNNIFRGNVANNAIYATNNATITNSILENNVVSGCVIYNTNALTANNNYWGTNNPDFAALINNGTPDNYAIITIEGETGLIPESTATYTVNFKTNDTDVICELPNYTVELSATNALSDENVTISKGTATFTYTASLDEITDTIKASVGSAEKASLEVSVKEDATAKGTYAELDRLIRKTTDELDLGKDYTFDPANDTGFENGITIDKSITINGHGFKINSTDLAKLFNVVEGGNLTLKDVVLVTDYIYSGTYNTARPESSFKNLGIVTLNNVTFTTNQNNPSTLAAFAAPIYNANTLNIVNSKFVNSNINTNSQYCFGLIDNSGTLNIENTLFDSNSLIDNSTMSSTYLTGLIYNMGTLTLNGVNMTNNYVETPNNGRGLIRAYTNSKVTIDNSIFENNTVYSKSRNAAGTAIYAESGTMTIANSRFINNTGAISGGAVYSSIAITFENNTFEKNNASSYGGAIYGGSSSIYINNTFKENKAEQGGALYSSGSLQSSKTYPFTKNTFIDNYASKYGGAVYAGSAIGTTQNPIDNNVFINNEALEKGGAIYSTGAVRVINTLFQENTAGEGVAIYSTSSTACQITYTIFDNNVIKSPTGGLLYVRGASTLENNFWGTNTPNFEDLIKVSGGTLTAPANIAQIVIEGNETLFESDVYIVSFKGNTSTEILDLPDFAVNITSDLNTITPASLVITDGEAIFTYNLENYGTDTIKVIRNNVELANLPISVPVPKETPEFTIAAGDVNYGDELNLTFTLINGPTGENIYKWTIFSIYGLQLETGNVTQNNEIITTKSYNAGSYKIVVALSDYEGWNDLDVNDTFEIRQFATEITPTITVNDDDTVEIQISITSSNDNITGTVSCEIDTPYSADVENGAATITTNILSPKKYQVTLTYSGDTNYAGNATDIEFIIKNTVSADVFNITKGDDNKTYTFSIKLPENATGNLTVAYGVQSETKALENGAANITIAMPTGSHDVTLTYSGDEYYKSATNMSTIYIAGEEIPADSKNASMDIPEGTTAPEFTINLPSDATGNFTVYVDGTPYTEPLVNGSATVKVPDLSVGNHTISTEYSGDGKYEGFKTENKTVNIPKASIPGGENAINMTTPEGSATPSYSINLPKDATGNLTVTVDGKNYTAPLVNGSATVNVPKLAPGNHNITVTYSGDEKYSSLSKNINYNVPQPVVKLVKPKDITMLYTAKTPYKVRVTVDGKAVGAGEVVTMKFNGKTYKVKTDKNGYATLKLPDAKPKKAKYTITATYKGVKVTNKVKVNSVIKAKNVKVKKSKKVNKIKVTLKKVNKKYLKGKKITLKIKGKKIKAKTNKKGVATFKVKKNVLKKLKVGKKYKYTVTFGKDTVTKKVTIKK